jgi:hypothetical protein
VIQGYPPGNYPPGTAYVDPTYRTAVPTAQYYPTATPYTNVYPTANPYTNQMAPTAQTTAAAQYYAFLSQQAAAVHRTYAQQNAVNNNEYYETYNEYNSYEDPSAYTTSKPQHNNIIFHRKQDERGKDGRQMCRDFLHGICNRGDTCRFSHQPLSLQEQQQAALVALSNNNNIQAQNNLSTQISSNLQLQFQQQTNMKQTGICINFLRGLCDKGKLRLIICFFQRYLFIF